LGDDVTFQDGTPFDAGAVTFGFDRMLKEDHPYHATGPFPLSFFFNTVEDVEAVDADTVTFHLSEPYAPFLSNLAYATGLLDPERAAALIREAGAEGTNLTFYVTEGGSGMLDPLPMGAAIQADLAKVGLDVAIKTYEWNTFLGEVNPGPEGKADMAEAAWMTNDPDTLPFLALRTDAWPDKGGFNSGYRSSLKVDDLLEKARVSINQDERAGLYKQMQAIVHDDAPWAFVANWKQNAATTDAVAGFKLQPSFFLLLKDVTKG
jgi:ABC-type transport system substrate-binding protein